MKFNLNGVDYWTDDTAAVITAGVLQVPVVKVVTQEVRDAQVAVDAAKAALDKISAITNAELLAWAKEQPNNPTMAREWAVATLDAATRALKDARKAAKVLA